MKQIEQVKPKKIDDEFFDKKDLKFNYNVNDCHFELDALQDKLLQFYLRSDRKFRMAFHTDYTQPFFEFIKDKVKLNEVFHLSTIGQVRSSKSSSMISLCIFHQALYNRKFTIDYICGNQYEYLEKIQTMPEDKLTNRVFLLNEDKQSTFGMGSVAKKMKLQDVQNIIAKAGISTISINPIAWSNPYAFYGSRAMGRCFKTGVNRFMLYNLQSSKSTTSPMGNIYIPIYRKIVPESYWKSLEESYFKKKDKWIEAERRGESDIFAELRKNVANSFLKDKQFLSLEKKKEKLTYVTTKLGSEWTKAECDEILSIVNMIQQGINFDK